MKILILSSPKTGNVFIANVLQKYFNSRLVSYDKFFDSHENVVSFEHVSYTAELHNSISVNGIYALSLFRNPSDQFVSYLQHIKRKGDFDCFTDKLKTDSELPADYYANLFRTWFKCSCYISLSWTNYLPTVSYDSFLSDPIGTFEKLFSYWGLELDRDRLLYSLLLNDYRILYRLANPQDKLHFVKTNKDQILKPEVLSLLAQISNTDHFFLAYKKFLPSLPAEKFLSRSVTNIFEYYKFGNGENFDVVVWCAFIYSSFILKKFQPFVSDSNLGLFLAWLLEESEVYGIVANNYILFLLDFRPDVFEACSHDGVLDLAKLYIWIMSYGVSEMGINTYFVSVLEREVISCLNSMYCSTAGDR